MNSRRGLAGSTLVILLGLGLVVIVGGSYMFLQSFSPTPQNTQAQLGEEGDGESTNPDASSDLEYSADSYQNSAYFSNFGSARDFLNSKGLGKGSVDLQAVLSTGGNAPAKKSSAASGGGVSKNVSNIKKIESALDSYHQDNGTYPTELSSLVPLYVPSVPNNPNTNAPYEYTQIQEGLSYQLEAGSGSGSGSGSGGGELNSSFITAHQVPYCVLEQC